MRQRESAIGERAEMTDGGEYQSVSASSLLDRQASRLLERSVERTGSQSAILFLWDKRNSRSHLHRLYVDGLPRTALSEYTGIISRDPFLSPDVIRRCEGSSCNLVLEPTDADVRRQDHAAQYWKFLSRHEIDITGAVIKPITFDLLLVASLHRSSKRSGPGIATVAEPIANLLDYAASQLVLKAVEALERESVADTGDWQAFAQRYKLNVTEMNIISLAADGYLNKQIAFELDVPEYTIENHLRRIYEKVGVKSKSALVSRIFLCRFH